MTNKKTNDWRIELQKQKDFSEELFKQCVLHGDTSADQRKRKVTMDPLHYKGYTIELKRFGRTPRYILTGNNLVFEGFWFDVAVKLYELTNTEG